MTQPIEYTHYVPSYFKMPDHPITVALIGVGGNGSRMLIRLAEIHQALIQLGHKGLYVTAHDPDKVSESNVGRQAFYPADIGQNKATVLIGRVNRSYGLNWDAKAKLVTARPRANILITCVDNVKSRVYLHNALIEQYPANKERNDYGSQSKTYYWLDLGNSKSTGQVILGTVMGIKQPEKVDNTIAFLPNVCDLFPDIMDFEDVHAPSCSMAEALQRQDLCINQMMACYAQKLLWSIFKEIRIKNHGVFINLETLSSNPLTVRPNEFQRKKISLTRRNAKANSRTRSKQKKLAVASLRPTRSGASKGKKHKVGALGANKTTGRKPVRQKARVRKKKVATVQKR